MKFLSSKFIKIVFKEVEKNISSMIMRYVDLNKQVN